MRKTGKIMVAFLTALITPALAYTSVRAPVSVYATAHEPLGISGEEASALAESGGETGVAVATTATPTDKASVSREPLAAIAAVSPPIITKNPDNLHIEPDAATANFYVEADGDGLDYQWQASSIYYGDATWTDDDVIWENITDDGTVIGAITSSLTITPDNIAEWDDTGFRCIVTDNQGAKVESDAAILDSGGYPEITSVLGIPIGAYYTMSRAGKPEYAIELNVTVSNEVSIISVDDIAWESGTLIDPPDDVFLSLSPPPPEGSQTYEQTLNPGQNDVYVSLFYEESYIYYRISITCESASGGSSEPSGGSSEPGDGGSSEPGDGGSSEPGDGGSSEPGDGGSSEPGDGGSSEPGDGGSSEPGDGGSSEPGDGGSSEPGDGGSSEPGNGGSSEPGNGGSSEPGNSPDDDSGSGISFGTDHGDDGDSGSDAQDAGNKPAGIRPTASTAPSPPREEAVIMNVNGNPSTGGGDMPDAPETGDKSNAALWIIMLISPVLALSGLVAVYMGRRDGKG